MVFAPKLEGGVAYNAPVQQPSAMEAVAGLFNFGLKTLAEEDSKAPKLTQDEKFAIAVKEFEESKGATFNWDRKGMREFIFNYPQFTSQATSYAENLGVMTAAPEEVARDAAVEWFKTPEGMLAVAESQRLPEDQREAYLAGQVTKVKQQEAKIAELERNAAQYTAEGTLLEKQWDVLKPTSKDMVDNTVSAILGPMLTEVSNGVTVEIPPELQAQLGIRYTTVDMNNIGAVLSDAKVFLSNQARGAYTNQFGYDALPSEDWNKEVFAGLDSLIEVSKAFDTPQERAATLQALIDTEMYKKLDENGVAVITRLAQTIPAETLGRLIPMMSEFDSKFMEVLTDNGSILTTKGIQDKVADTSKTEAEALASDTIQFFEHGFVPEFFTLFKESAAKSGFNVVDATSFKKIAGDHIKEITALASSNPEFRGEFGGWLASDIQQTHAIIRQNLPSEVELVVNSLGQFSLVYRGTGFKGRAEMAKGTEAFKAAELKKAADSLPEGMNLDTLNQKIATLGLMGEFGKEIQGAIGILNTNPEKPAAEPTRGRGETPRGKGRSRGTMTASSIGDEAVPADDPRWGGPGISDDPQWQAENLVTIESGNGESWQVNRLAAAAFQGFLTELESTGYGVKSSGGFNYRPIRGSKTGKLSEHGKGLAIDLNAGTNPLGSEETDLPPNISEIAAKYGLKWGGDFKGRKDPMHFEYVVNGGSPTVAPVSEAEEGTLSLSLGSASSDTQRPSNKAPTQSTALSTGTPLSFDSPEVQEIIEKSQSAPEEAIMIAKEVLAGKPMDPAIKSLIEALVRIGEKA